MSDSNRVSVAHRAETTPGTFDAGQMTALNFSSETLTATKTAVEENTIRSDRNLRGVIKTSLFPQGGIAFDLMYGNLSNLLEGQMGASWGTLVDITATNATVASNVITAAAGTPYSAIVVGQTLRITYNSTTYVGRVSAVGGGGSSITIVGVSLADDAVADAVDLKGRQIKNSTTLKAFSLEVEDTQLSNEKFRQFLGMVPNVFNLNSAAEQIVTGDMQFLGMNAPNPTTASISAGSYPYATAVANGALAALSQNMGQIWIDDTDIGTTVPVQGVTLSVNNNVRRDVAINVTEMGWGTFMVTGQVTAYFKGGLDMMMDFYNHEESSLWVVWTDNETTANRMSIYLPTVHFTNFTRNTGGRNQPVMGTFDFTAIYNSTIAATMAIDEIAA